MTVPSSRQREIVTSSLGRLGVTVPVMSLVTCAVVAVLYVQSRTWQVLAAAILLVVNALAFLLAGALARQGLEQAGGAVMVVTVWSVFTSAGLLWSGAGLALGVTVLLAASLLTVLVITPRNRAWFWLGSIASGAAIWAMGGLALPWMRADVNASPATWLGIRLLLGSVVVILAAQCIRAYRRATLIPTRLTVLAVVLVLSTAAAMSGALSMLETLNSRQRLYAHLETNVVLKQEAIRAWAEHLDGALDSLAVLDEKVGQLADFASAGDGTLIESETADAVRDRLNLVLLHREGFREIALADARGEVITSTDPAREGTLVEGWIAPGDDHDDPSVAPAAYDALAGERVMLFTRPLERDGIPVGVLLGWADLAELQQIAAYAGEMPMATYLVGPDAVLLTEPMTADVLSSVHSEAIDRLVEDQPPVLGRTTYTSHSGGPVLGAYAWVDTLPIGIVSEVPTAEAMADGRTRTLVSAALAVLASLIAGAVAYAAAQDVVQPLSALSDAALSIADGDLDQLVDVPCDDEVGALTESFNMMSAQLQDTVSDIERRLRARTRALAAVVEASEAATSALEEAELLQRIVDLTRERFSLAYVGLFVLDSEHRYAVLRAGTGEVGATMLNSGWRLLSGGASMIGQCVATGESLVSQRGSEAVVRLENPLLPDVRSEAAIPIGYGARILGAMTVQSLQRGAFDDVDLAALQAVADQVATALQATSADDKTWSPQPAQVDGVPGATLRDGAVDVMGYDHRGAVVEPLGHTLLPEVVDGLEQREPIIEGDTLRVPFVQDGEVVGVLGVERAGGWRSDAVALVVALAEQLKLAARYRSRAGTGCDVIEPRTLDS